MRRLPRAVVLAVAGVVVLVAATLVWAGTVKIVAEGEDYYSIKPSMAKATSEVASGNAYIHIPLRRPHAAEESEPSDDGNARFKIKIPSSGTYYLYARCNWYDGCGNSFYVKVDDGAAKTFGQDASYGKWLWRPMVSRTKPNPFRYQLSAGEHIIRFQNREDGAKLDQFLLTTNSRYTPVGKETRTAQYIVTP